MRVFVVGASGAIGRRLVPQLLERGHEVIGSARSPEKAERLRRLGAEAVVLDALDARAVREAVAAAEPDAIVHQATALTGISDFKHFDRTFAQTNRLRTEGTDNLLAAAREAGVGKFVAQSNANHRYAREGGPVKSEGDPLDSNPVAASARVRGGDGSSRPGRHGRGWDCAPLRHLLRRPRRRDGRSRTCAQVPDRGRRWRRLVVHPPRRCRRGDRARARARRPRHFQHRRRRALPNPGVAAGAREDRRGQAAPTFPAPARPARSRARRRS